MQVGEQFSERRRAIIMIGLSLASASIAFWTTISLWVSSSAVGSSRMAMESFKYGTGDTDSLTFTVWKALSYAPAGMVPFKAKTATAVPSIVKQWRAARLWQRYSLSHYQRDTSTNWPLQATTKRRCFQIEKFCWYHSSLEMWINYLSLAKVQNLLIKKAHIGNNKTTIAILKYIPNCEKKLAKTTEIKRAVIWTVKNLIPFIFDNFESKTYLDWA